MTIHTRLNRQEPQGDGFVKFVIDVTGYDVDNDNLDIAHAEEERRLELLEDLVTRIGSALIPYLASTRKLPWNGQIDVVLQADDGEAKIALEVAYKAAKVALLSSHRRRRAQALKIERKQETCDVCGGDLRGFEQKAIEADVCSYQCLDAEAKRRHESGFYN